MKLSIERTTGLAFVVLLALSLKAAATDGTATLEFTTEAIPGKYSPRHVVAVWVTDSQTNYVKTVLRHAGKRQNKLHTWNKVRRDDKAVDGVTGATLKTHSAHTAKWDGQDAKGNPAPDGDYLFFVEVTSSNSQGPVSVIPFTKGPKALNHDFARLKNLSKVKVTFTPAASLEK